LSCPVMDMLAPNHDDSQLCIMQKTFVVYILTNTTRSTLYTGITGYMSLRMFQHKHKLQNGFTAKYNVNRLIYYEKFSHPGDAIAREKQIKGWRRSKKIALIEAINPKWNDLAGDWDAIFANPGPSTRVSPAGENAGAPPSLRMTPLT
jgi:putative endonuclease